MKAEGWIWTIKGLGDQAVDAVKGVFKKKVPPRTCCLDTPWTEQPVIPWNEYPRPQLKRESFLCLNGSWDLKNNGEDWGTILVPYPVESKLSGQQREVKENDVLEYSRTVVLPEMFRKDRVILQFGAVDQTCKVYVNNAFVGEHEGGYLPFSFDVTEHLVDGENLLRVEVRDPLDKELAYGKQRRDRGGMWYTPVSGIWQTVWMESVPEEYIRKIRITPTLNSVTIETVGGSAEKYLTCDGKRYAYTGDSITIQPENPHLWSPEDPYLYSFTIEAGEDKVASYFALRTVSIERHGEYARLCLNGKPYFFHGLLDQGYFPDGIYLPGAPEGITFDVSKMKELGFNTLRKHIKIEPERFYYDCDRLGMIVCQDLVNCGEYHYFVDTVLPTLGWKKGITHSASERQTEAFMETARGTVEHLYNHPCILYYTMFNEGWGQFREQEMFEYMKSLEPTRIWDATSGWFNNCDSDVQSEHIYFGDLKRKADGVHPLVLSEFGGYSCSVPEHSFNLDEVYGYRKFTDCKDMENALIELYENEIIPQIPTGLSGCILTQVSDVEDETNGLVTFDRKVVKVQPDTMQAVAKKLQEALK